MKLFVNSNAVALVLVVVLAGCASAPTPRPEQSELTALAQPYAAQLAAAGVSRIQTPSPGGDFVKVGTPYGFFDIRYREGLPHAPFVLVASGDTPRVLSNTYDPAKLAEYRAAMDWVIPEVLRVAPGNEAAMRRLQTASH